MPNTNMDLSESQSPLSRPFRWFLLLFNVVLAASIPLNMVMLPTLWHHMNWAQVLFQLGALIAATAFLLGDYGFRSFLGNSKRRTGKLIGRMWTFGITLIVASYFFNAKGMWDHNQCMDRGGNWDRATFTCNK